MRVELSFFSRNRWQLEQIKDKMVNAMNESECKLY